jgi:acyl transferase domain-containing protein
MATAAMDLHPPRLRMVSNLTGAVAGPEITTPAYWRRHAREAVYFAQGVETLSRLGCELFIEIGPHPTLLGMAQAAATPGSGTWLPSLRKGRDGWQQLLESLAAAYTSGIQIDWTAFDQPYPRQKLVLPTYPFQRERYWVEPRRSTPPSQRPAKTDQHPLLGKRLRSALRQVQFEQEIGAGSLSYLDQHRVFSTTILPATGFAELALGAARAVLGTTAVVLDDLLIHAPLALGPDETRVLQTVLVLDGRSATVEVFSQTMGDEQWVLHVTGAVHHAPVDLPEDTPQPAFVRTRCTQKVPPEDHYARLRARGLDLGPSLQVVRRIWRGEGEALGELALSEDEAAEAGRYLVHPALLDACLQLIAIAAPDVDETYLPIAIDRLRVWGQPGARALAHGRLLPGEGTGVRRETMVGEIRLFDQEGRLLLEIDGLRLKRADQIARAHTGQESPDTWLYSVDWRPLLSVKPVPHSQAVFLAAPAQIRTAAEARLGSLDAELNLSHYTTLIPALEALATDSIILALARLGWQPAPGEQYTSRQLAERLNIVPAQEMLLDRFLTILAEDRILRVVPEGWEVVAIPAAAISGRAEQLAMRYPAARGDIEMTRRCGEGLADALRGTIDPLQLLFPGGSISTAEQLYRESPVARAYTSLVAEACACLRSVLAPVGLPLPFFPDCLPIALTIPSRISRRSFSPAPVKTSLHSHSSNIARLILRPT